MKLATPAGRGRRCGFWISDFVSPGRPVVLDTAVLAAEDRMYAGPYPFPPDCLLVVVHPSDEPALLERLLASPGCSPADLAAEEIDAFYRSRPAHDQRGWFLNGGQTKL